MWLLAYYNKDRIGFRLLSISENIEVVFLELKKQTLFDKSLFKKQIHNGIYATQNNFFVIRTNPKPIQHSGLPYGCDLKLIDELWQLAVASARKDKINGILST